MINQNKHDVWIHLKPEVKNSDTTAMTMTTNEDCIGWWDVNWYLMKKEQNFW